MKIVLRNEICDKLENIVKNLKVTKHCIGCEGLDLTNKDPHHHPTIEITQKCNYNCIFCYSKLVKIKSGIYGINPKNPVVDKYTGITISQYGEPLINIEKVKEAIKFTKSLNLRCDLQTNGSYLNEDLLKNFKELGLDLVMISLSSFSEETHKKLTNNNNNNDYKTILNNIILCSKYFHTIVRSIYIPNYNEEELINLAEYLNNNSNVKEIMIHQLIIHNDNKNNLKNIVNIEEVGKIKDLLLLIDKMKQKAPNINITIKGCLLVNLENLDGFLLNNIKSDCFSEVPIIKRDYYKF